MSAAAVAAVFDVLAEPTRRRLLDAVRDGERSVGELVDEIGMHQPGVSRHLKVPRDAGLVEVRRDAQRRLYRLRPEPLMELDAWLEPYRRDGPPGCPRTASAAHVVALRSVGGRSADGRSTGRRSSDGRLRAGCIRTSDPPRKDPT